MTSTQVPSNATAEQLITQPATAGGIRHAKSSGLALVLALVFAALLAGQMVAPPHALASEVARAHPGSVSSAAAISRVEIGKRDAKRTVGFPRLAGSSGIVGPKSSRRSANRKWVVPVTSSLMRVGWTLVRRCLDDQACTLLVRTAVYRLTQWLAKALAKRFQLTIHCILAGPTKERFTCLMAPRG